MPTPIRVLPSMARAPESRLVGRLFEIGSGILPVMSRLVTPVIGMWATGSKGGLHI
jgi:hypothetical protein